ncbi:MAG: response regulator [Sphingobacteriales bacterium]|nr:response regulator [Sphingobacteriales bacterium]
MLVLIVDQSVQITERLAEVLSEAKHIRTIHKAISYEGAIAFFRKNNPDIVLLDTGLPANGSVDLLTEIKKANDTTAIIALSIRTDGRTQEQFVSRGVSFFLDKYHDFGKLPGIVDAIGVHKKSEGLLMDDH